MKKVEFTKDQFKFLLELVYLGEWMTNSHRLEDESIASYDEICFYLFAHAKEFGLQECYIPMTPRIPTLAFTHLQILK